MKLYYLNPNTYGDEYFVMSNDMGDALEAIKKHMRATAKRHYQENIIFCKRMNSGSKMYNVDENRYKKNYESELKRINELSLDNLGNNKYTLDEYNINEVIQSEIC